MYMYIYRTVHCICIKCTCTTVYWTCTYTTLYKYYTVHAILYSVHCMNYSVHAHVLHCTCVPLYMYQTYYNVHVLYMYVLYCACTIHCTCILHCTCTKRTTMYMHGVGTSGVSRMWWLAGHASYGHNVIFAIHVHISSVSKQWVKRRTARNQIQQISRPSIMLLTLLDLCKGYSQPGAQGPSHCMGPSILYKSYMYL